MDEDEKLEAGKGAKSTMSASDEQEFVSCLMNGICESDERSDDLMGFRSIM